LGPSESIIINVKFIPKEIAVVLNARVNEYLCIRSKFGIPEGRVSLIGYNLPAVRLCTRTLEFGWCMVGKSKSATFTVENLIPYECPIMLSVSNNCKSMFTLPFVQGLLSKDDLTTISVVCTPTHSGTISTTLYLIAFGIQTFEIKMIVHCGNSLIILDRELQFGPTDIYFNGVSKNMLFKNLNKLQAAPITFKSSSNELLINRNKELILLPGETREVPVEFQSILSGNRSETVKITSPNNPTRTVEVIALSGPEISVPVFENIYFPPTII
jgi:hypothetical protein